MDVAYDVPIPGYKTKTTLNLRLWSTKVAAEDFDLHAFNTGDHAKAYAAITNVEKVWIINEFMCFFFHICTGTSMLCGLKNFCCV